jgi:hypothetical protein
MRVTTAQLPEPPNGADRVFVTDRAVILLDGASAFGPQDVPAAVYADHLGGTVTRALQEAPDADLTEVLAEAISATADTLALKPGPCTPSSTVAMCRAGADGTIDLLLLGDSQIAMPGRVLRDERLAHVAAQQREAYRARLHAGHGYDDQHRALLSALQQEQLRHRNRPGGYWIAEADPQAAGHAFTLRVPVVDLPWCVLATDGAYRPMELHGWDAWADVAALDADALHDLLARCQQAESADPDGKLSPRAKRHDDKTIAAISL